MCIRDSPSARPACAAKVSVAARHVARLQVRAGLRGLGAATAEHSGILGHLMTVAAAVAKQVRRSGRVSGGVTRGGAR
eukprot:1603664-Prymnesium_polylepis.1